MFHVYGCFCSPECACAFLMNDKNIDTSTKFERYYLLNFIYGKIYNYEKNIKPAPSPYYLLDKYYDQLNFELKLLNIFLKAPNHSSLLQRFLFSFFITN